jgi:hypothetical protein
MASSKTPDVADRARRGGASPATDDRRVVAVPRAWLALLTALVILPWLVAGAVYSWNAVEPAEPATALLDTPPSVLGAGPWGRLTATRIVVSPPLEYVSTAFAPVEPLVWYFPEATPDLLQAFLSSTGLAPADVAALQATARPDPAIKGLVVRPARDLVRRLTPEVRARLYVQLSRSGLNARQRHAYRFMGTPDAWFAGSLIAPATRALIAPLLYQHGGYTYFAEFDVMRDAVGDVEELRRLAKTLVRQSALLVELTVTDASDVTPLAEYWGRGGRRIDVRPLLESVASPETPRSIDVTHLLPAFARNHLYRYPRVRTADLERPLLANCLWSALNFFSDAPDDRFLNVDVALGTLKHDYYVVEQGFQLGDIIAFVDKDENLFHVAVHLADKLVFSKNGMSQLSPWTIMTVDDVTSFYQSRSASTRLIYHRRKDF